MSSTDSESDEYDESNESNKSGELSNSDKSEEDQESDDAEISDECHESDEAGESDEENGSIKSSQSSNESDETGESNDSDNSDELTKSAGSTDSEESNESDEVNKNESENINTLESESQSTSSGFVEDDINDIFEDAKEHVELLFEDGYDFEDSLEYLDKDSIFKEPPGLLGVEEYQIAIAKFIRNGISWEDTHSVLFQIARHSQVEKTVRQLYFTALAEEVQHNMSECITKVCCQRKKEFPDYLKTYEKPDITSELWEDVIALVEVEKTCLARLQFKNLKSVENAENDKQIQKLWKKTVSAWLQLINTLVPHFFDDSVERELLSCITNWFTSGEMTHLQLKKWKALFKKGHATDLQKLKQTSWEDGKYAKEHVSLFVSLLDDVETSELTRADDFEAILTPFLSDPTFRLVDRKTRLQVIGNGFFLSEIIDKILAKKTSSVSEINIYAKYFCGIDCNLENKQWHGMNLTIVTDKLTVWKSCTIDVSGIGYSNKVRGTATKVRYSGLDGEDGTDGRAGESSGNVVILTNQLKNPKKLMVKLNGGSGEGGQNGGAGADGGNGIKITKESFLNTILKYSSLYRDSWSSFTGYDPGSGWTRTCDKVVYKSYQEWIYRSYTHDDGREMTYSFAGDCGYVYNSYEIMFLIKGTDGEMGGSGGQNGVSGEGGNAGDFKAKSLKTGADLKDFKQVQMKKGKDGLDGKPGVPGNPGQNGNDMGMNDRSSGSWSYSAREARRFHGETQRNRLQIKYEYSQGAYNALNGYRKHELECNDHYTTFSADGVPEIRHTEMTEKRTASDRRSKSVAVSKQTISIATLLEEFAEISEGDELNIGDCADFKEFEADEDEEEEEEEQVQEEISVIRTLVEDSQEYEKNLRRSIVKPEEVIEEIMKAAGRLNELNLVELIALWKRIFSVPLDTNKLKSKLTSFMKLLCDEKYQERSFQGRRTLSNGMSHRSVLSFIDHIKAEINAKQELSDLKMTLDLDATGPKTIDLMDDELSDVVSSHLDTFWMEVDSENYKTKLINALTKQVGDNDLHSSKLLLALYKVNLFLKTKEQVFKPFYRESFNWADIPAVQSYLESFLTDKEKKALADKKEKEQKEADEKAKKEEEKKKKEEEKRQREAEKNLKRNPPGDNIPSPTDVSPEEEEPPEKEEIFAEEEKTHWYSNLINSKEKSEAFKSITKEFKDEKKTAAVFSELISILKEDKLLAQRFCLDRTSVRNTMKPPGSSPQSLVHMFYFSEQILQYNVQLYRYYLSFEAGVTIPNDWYNPSKELPMETVEDLVQWAADRELPRINCDMEYFMKQNGIRCRAYRQMIADEKKANLQLFCESGYCKMRLVESLNPEYSEVHRLIIKDGELKTIGVNEPLRKLRAVMDTVQLNISLPQSSGQLQLAPYFPDSFAPKVIEWTEAAIVATGCEMLPRFLQRLFELRGNSMSIVDLQFIVNTLIEANRNFNVPLESLCLRILSKDGNLLDIFLALRVLGAMKGTAPKLDPLVRKLYEIKDSRLKALFGSKLHEMTITDEVLTSLINMLAHAEDRVAQLEKLELKEWVNIAKCQKWNSYAPLLKAYGTVGYYIVLLDTMGKEEGQRLERIIEQMKNKNETCIILEKDISKLTFLITNNEVEFNDDYELALARYLQMISEKCVQLDQEQDILKSGCYVNTGNIHLVVDELLQMEMMDYIMTGEDEKEIAEAVMPKDDRSLSDLIKLSINPQDSPETMRIRQEEMAKIKEILARRNIDDIYGQKLEIIDEKLFEIYGKRLRDTQKIAILSAAKSGKNLLSQVNTGEGKSFIISCLAILRILVEPEDTVDIITSSSVLAQRDAEAMQKLYEVFNIQAGHNCDEDIEKRKLAYKCAVVYGDIARFERDYLLQTFYKKNILGSRTRCNVIVDEVDSMLLDNGSNMLYLSHNVPGLELLDSFFVYLHKLVNTPSINEADVGYSAESLRQKILGDMCGLVTKEDIKKLIFDPKNVTEVGKVWRILVTQNIIDSEGVFRENWEYKSLAKELLSECGQTLAGRVFAMLEIVKNRRQEIEIPAYLKQFVITHLDEFIKNAKQGLFLKHNDEYVVDLDRTGRVTDLHPVITIIDKGTGTDLSTSQWSEGLHQFLQLKHGCRLTPISLKAVFISNVSYLKGYKRLNGFSGTLGSVEESKSLVQLYNADMMKIPTWKPKMFNENAPILAKTVEDWIKEIFDEVCDQVRADRSVLVICQSIAKVEELNKGFKKLYEEIESPEPKEKEAFDKVIVYTREFDEVDFATEGELPCSRIIISTNLAGRGTDISLSSNLAKAGGLHVIVSFLPENSRIENQAYGRAARCGQPGSGQIICLVQEEDNGANNIFQLKQFRDNAEVHRLRSLKQFYDYHIAVEETALNMFKDHCSVVMESVHSASEELTITQVIYFALLDEWAAWLDSKAQDINQCEKTKNGVLKGHIINSVKDFLRTHPLPENGNYIESLKWINCPQPWLSIALIQLQNEETKEADDILDKVIEKFPDFKAEACYYKGIIEQWKIREALQIQPPPEKDKDGKMVEGTPGIRLNVANWLLRNVLYSDDCPDSFVQKCMERVHKSSEYFLLSRSLFATRIRKKNDMTRIVKMLQQNTSEAGSRGFAVQQEESTAVLECFIGSIDDIMGHRATPEDVKLGDEHPHLTIHRFKEVVKRADIITPPQLANQISDEQLRLLSNNHCLPVSALQFGFQQIYKDPSIAEYEGQKIIRAEELAAIFSLPSIRGFWESMRRAGCFLQEQVFIAVKKVDKEKVPVLKGLQSMILNKSPLHVQLSTENLAEYDLYDVHGDAVKIKEDDVKNAELQEAQEARLVHLEVVGTINLPYLSSLEHLDQFSYLSVEDVATELLISPIEAEWIMEMLVYEGVVEKRQAEIEKPLTPEEIDAKHKEMMEKKEKLVNGADRGEIDGKEKAKPENDEKGKEKEENGDKKKRDEKEEENKKPKENCIAYFPVSRISCDCFPANTRHSIQMMLTRNFSYHYAFNSLKSGILSAIESQSSACHQISLPTDPYADLCQDLQNLGVVQHSRVTSVLTDIYKPKEDGTVIKYAKKLFGKKFRTDYIDHTIYKQLEPKAPKLCTNKCDLIETALYLEARNVPASGEIRKAMSNGLRKVAIIQEKNWWKWALGIFLKVSAVVLPIMLLAASVFPVLAPYVLIAVAIAAVVGTVLFCMSLYSENQKIASTLNLAQDEEFHMLRTYHESALDAPKRLKVMETQRKGIEKTAAHFIQQIIYFLEMSTRITSSEEDVSLWVETLENCAENSTHLPLLQRSIELWFRSNSRNIQEVIPPFIRHTLFQAHFDGIFNESSLTKSKKVPKIRPWPHLPFAFSSILISEVNRRKRNSGKRSKKAITTKLDFGNYPVEQVAVPTETSCPLSFALNKTLKNLLTPMVEENIAAIIDPVLNGIDTAFRKNREDKIKAIEQDASTMKKRQLQHSAERLAKENTVDFLATDLHNIFQRIAFRDISKPMLQHMIRYNYPLSAHCAKTIFDACVTILQSVDKVLKQADIELKRNEQTIFTYHGIKDGCPRKQFPPLVIGLEKDSFYILEVSELTKNHRKYHHGLFQALCEYSTKFSDNFGLDSQLFVDKLHEIIAMEQVLDKRWISDVSWNGNEKMRCSVAIW